MRISDWSSDVCSSDLAGRIRLDIARAGDRDVERLRDEPVGVDIARAGHVDLARFRGAALDVQVARARHGQFHPLRGELHDLELARAGHGRLDRVARSEEHTSELPSLMCNSYAVLCLQKKN